MGFRYRRPSIKIGGATIRKNKKGISISSNTLLGGRRTYNTATGRTTTTYKTGIKGLSYQSVSGGKRRRPSQRKKKGGFIATCVYGSYDCPEVWTLRRFRDETLGRSFFGRLFIRSYYAAAPIAVRWFGNSSWFRRIWRGRLDRLVDSLREKGVADTPYEDRNWRITRE